MTTIKAKVSVLNGALIPSQPLTVKNIIQDQTINSVQDIPDVSVIDTTNGATLVYNVSTDLYEIKQLDIDGGEF